MKVNGNGNLIIYTHFSEKNSKIYNLVQDCSRILLKNNESNIFTAKV